MMLKVPVPVGKEHPTPLSTRYVTEYCPLVPVFLVRRPCGRRGAATSRYHYVGWFHVPADALIEPGSANLRTYEGVTYLTAPIIRKCNPQFRPPRQGWEASTDGHELYDLLKNS